MKNFKVNLRLFAACVLAFSVSSFSPAFAQNNDAMVAHYIDVGQGLAILLEFPKGAVLIDAGGQKDMRAKLTYFLGQFFARRADLHNTLDAVMITHQHVDHDQGLQDVADHFKILNYIDNGANNPDNSGQKQIWMQGQVNARNIKYEAITFDMVSAAHNLRGLTDLKIDPVGGSPTDPQIVIYSGKFKTGQLSATDLGNPNDHSLVIKVVYGKSKFLFTGDLEEGAIRKVLQYYAGTHELDVDVLQIGHHGAANGVTDAWLKAVTPRYAVISCGQWNFGMKPDSTATAWTTYAYAHPTKKAITMLEENIPDSLPHPVKAYIGIKGLNKKKPWIPPKFELATITKNIYVTAWNGNIAIKATADGQYSVISDR